MQLSRRRFVPVFLAGARTLRAAAANSGQPNILFIQTDDQRFDDLGCAGNRVIRTPNLDRIAEQGVRFRNAFVTTAICCSSRASVLTGQHMWRHGIRDFAAPLSESQLDATYPVLLQRAGYRTAFIGKYAIGSARTEKGAVDARGFAPGAARPSLSLPANRFDFWFGFPQSINFLQAAGGEKRHLTPLMTERAIEFLRSGPPQRPFCMSLNFKEPHGPHNYFDPDVPDNYKEAAIAAPATHTREDFESQPDFLRKSLNGTAQGQWPADAAERVLRSARTDHRLVEGVDLAVGRIMSALRELNLDGNTVVIFASDNGSMRGAHGLTGKWLMYEESIRVPLLIRDPRLAAASRGTVRDEMALNIDLAPTMLRLAGLDPPACMQGRDLSPLLSGPKPGWREDWFYEHTYTPEDERPHIARCEGVRATRWKYTRYIDTMPRYEQLFDLAADPLERHNLAGKPEHKAALDGMRARWQQIRREVE